MEFSYDIRIPKERIAVLIGTKGQTKRKLENDTKTSIDVDSRDGIATLSGTDAICLMTARDIVKAIARGFNPNIAILLLNQDYMFELINLNELSRNKNDLERLKGRIIGTKGKSRELIEEMTETYISVYGKTIGIIGDMEKVAIAKRAIGKIIEGSPHATVFKWLENQRKLMNIGFGSF